MPIEPASDPRPHEDSVTRISTLQEEGSRGVVRRFDRRTLTLIDGPNAGDIVEYWLPVSLVEIDDSTPIQVQGDFTANVVIDDDPPLNVIVNNAVTIDDTTPIDVNVTNQLAEPLDVNIVSPLEPWDVNLVSPVPLPVTLDEPIEVTLDEPIDVNATIVNTNNISVEPKDAGVPGTIVPGSRWSITGGAAVALAPFSITSPTPGANERVVVDTVTYSIQITVNLGVVVNKITLVDSVQTLWQLDTGFVAAASVGSVQQYSGPRPIVIGAAGSAITMTYPAVPLGNTITVSLNMGGYIVDVS